MTTETQLAALQSSITNLIKNEHFARENFFASDHKTDEELIAEIMSKVQAALVEANPVLDFTIRTDEQGDYIYFFDGKQDSIRGDKTIMRFMYDRLAQLTNKENTK